jgi:hypothetical protein
MVVHCPGVILEGLGVVQGFDFALDRLVLDLAIRLAQPVAVGVDPLLAGLAVLPTWSPFGTRGRLSPCGRICVMNGLLGRP